VPRRCSICDHPDRREINREIVAGVGSTLIASVYGVSEAAVRRHRKNHLLHEARERLASDPELGNVDVLLEMRNLYRRMGGFLAKAEVADDWPAVKAFHAEARKDLELLAKLTQMLQDGPATVVSVGIDQRAQTAILLALDAFPAARVAVADALRELE
jgi:hypothetical protein